MATVLQDNFTNTAGTNLTAHTPQVGTWVNGLQYNAGSVATWLIGSQNTTVVTVASSSTVSSIVSSTNAGTNNVIVTADLIKRSVTSGAGGIIICFNNNNYNHYLARLDNTSSPIWQIFKWNGSNPTLLGSSTAGANTALGTYKLRLSLTGTTLLFEYSINDGSTWNTAVSANDASPLPAGRVGMHIAGSATGDSNTGYHFDNFLATDALSNNATAYTLTATPSTFQTGGSTTITATSNGELVSPVTVTLSDNGASGTFSNDGIITLAAGTNTSGTATYSNSGGNQVVSIVSTNNGGLTNGSTTATVSTGAVTLAPGNANYFCSPYNWLISGGFATSNTAGAYVKVRFSGSTSLSVAVNVANLVSASVAAGDYPWIRWVVGNGNWQQQQLTSATTSISLASGLNTANTYEVQLYFWRVVNFNIDRWTTPVNALRLGQFSIDGGGTFLAPILRSKRALIYGDSITEGLTVSASNPTHSSVDGYAFHLGNALNAEYGARGFGGQGWEWDGVGNAPKHTTAWNSYYSGQSLLTGGLFSPVPDFIIVVLGTNDGLNAVNASTLQTAIQTWLSSARTAAGANCNIFVCIPFGGFQRTVITAAVAAYITANPSDTKVKLVDLGDEAQRGITAFALGASLYSPDGIHPTSFGHTRLAAMLAANINSPGTVNITATNVQTLSFISRPRRRSR